MIANTTKNTIIIHNTYINNHRKSIHKIYKMMHKINLIIISCLVILKQ